MLTTRTVALRVNAVRATNARVRRVQKGLELVITDPRLGEFAVDEEFTLELLELLHPPKYEAKISERRLEESIATDIGCTAAEWNGPAGGGILKISTAECSDLPLDLEVHCRGRDDHC